MLLGNLVLTYKIALSEPSSILRLNDTRMNPRWDPQSLTTAGAPVRAIVPADDYKEGDILSLTWLVPGTNGLLSWENASHGVQNMGTGPQDGDVVYGRVADYKPSEGHSRMTYLYPSLQAA
jgi:hypothetical protein